MVSVQPLLARRYDLSEGIVWDAALGVLWWTDIYACRLWQYDPVSGAEHNWRVPSALGSFALTATPGVLLLGLRKQLARFDTRTMELDMLAEVEADLPQTRINDGRCDRAGNFIFGTTTEDTPGLEGGFYRYSAAGVLSRLDLPAPTIANSLCLSPDGGTLYYTDTPSHRIMQCDYDAATGSVKRARLFAELAAGGPDGSCIDAAGYLWNAVWGAHNVTRYAPDGRVDRVIELPAAQPSCVAFGDAGLDTLYVTTAHRRLPQAEAHSGLVYRVTGLAVHGLPECRFGG
jgi:L-arabinonolactonase